MSIEKEIRRKAGDTSRVYGGKYAKYRYLVKGTDEEIEIWYEDGVHVLDVIPLGKVLLVDRKFAGEADMPEDGVFVMVHLGPDEVEREKRFELRWFEKGRGGKKFKRLRNSIEKKLMKHGRLKVYKENSNK